MQNAYLGKNNRNKTKDKQQKQAIETEIKNSGTTSK